MGGANLSLLLEEGVARDEGGEGVWEESWPRLGRGEDAAGGSPWERRCVHNTSQGYSEIFLYPAISVISHMNRALSATPQQAFEVALRLKRENSGARGYSPCVISARAFNST